MREQQSSRESRRPFEQPKQRGGVLEQNSGLKKLLHKSGGDSYSDKQKLVSQRSQLLVANSRDHKSPITP